MKQIKTKQIIRDRHLLDASSATAGRLAARAAALLIGKHKVSWQPHLDLGDWVEVLNIKQLKFSGKKEAKNVLHTHSGHPRGLKTVLLSKILQEHPEKLLQKMVSKMLPKNRLRTARLKRLIIK